MDEELFKPIRHKINRPSLRTLIGKKDLIGAEIGVYLGKNAENMLVGLDMQRLYLIDPYLNEDGKLSGTTTSSSRILELRYNSHYRLERFHSKIVWIEKKSEYAVNDIKDSELDFVYIDGDHTYIAVKKDIELYFPKVKLNGLFCGHDFDQPDSNNGVIQAVNEFFTVEKGYVIHSDVGLDDTRSNDWWVEKK